MEIVKVSKIDFEKLDKQIRKLSNEDLDKVAGGFHLCPCGCHQVDNACICPDDEDDV